MNEPNEEEMQEFLTFLLEKKGGSVTISNNKKGLDKLHDEFLEWQVDQSLRTLKRMGLIKEDGKGNLTVTYKSKKEKKK